MALGNPLNSWFNAASQISLTLVSCSAVSSSNIVQVWNYIASEIGEHRCKVRILNTF